MFWLFPSGYVLNLKQTWPHAQTCRKDFVCVLLWICRSAVKHKKLEACNVAVKQIFTLWSSAVRVLRIWSKYKRVKIKVVSFFTYYLVPMSSNQPDLLLQPINTTKKRTVKTCLTVQPAPVNLWRRNVSLQTTCHCSFFYFRVELETCVAYNGALQIYDRMAWHLSSGPQDEPQHHLTCRLSFWMNAHSFSDTL